jgi:hypothetical protein
VLAGSSRRTHSRFPCTWKLRPIHRGGAKVGRLDLHPLASFQVTISSLIWVTAKVLASPLAISCSALMEFSAGGSGGRFTPLVTPALLFGSHGCELLSLAPSVRWLQNSRSL